MAGEDAPKRGETRRSERPPINGLVPDGQRLERVVRGEGVGEPREPLSGNLLLRAANGEKAKALVLREEWREVPHSGADGWVRWGVEEREREQEGDEEGRREKGREEKRREEKRRVEGAKIESTYTSSSVTVSLSRFRSPRPS